MKKSEITVPPIRVFIRPMFLPTILVVLFVIITLGCQPFAIQKTPPALLSGAELFKSKCSQCHETELALRKYRSPGAWFETIARMKEKHNSQISSKEIKLLVQYHVERQKREAAVFNDRCQKCHPGKVFLEKALTPDQARAIIKRMQQKIGNTIEDKDIDIIVRYHVHSQQAALEKSLTGISALIPKKQLAKKRDAALFVKKCSICHLPARALEVTKDKEAWFQTIKRMQSYSKGEITDSDVESLVDFHITRQQLEINAFKETCTKCHDDERINSRSMTEEQWLETIKRMQEKAPELIPDEKIVLLAAYFHRREFTLAKIFNGKCHLCHSEGSRTSYTQDSIMQMNTLIALANQNSGRTTQVFEVNNLRSIHIQRQKRSMLIYESRCDICHQKGNPGQAKEPGKGKQVERDRAEWISFIAALQGVELSKEIQSTIDSQIDFHISRH